MTERMKKAKLLDEEIERGVYEEMIPHTLLLDFLEGYPRIVRAEAEEYPENEELKKTADIVEQHFDFVIGAWKKLIKEYIKEQVKEQTKPVKEYLKWLDKA